jgi:hypothetical protein
MGYNRLVWKAKVNLKEFDESAMSGLFALENGSDMFHNKVLRSSNP